MARSAVALLWLLPLSRGFVAPVHRALDSRRFAASPSQSSDSPLEAFMKAARDAFDFNAPAPAAPVPTGPGRAARIAQELAELQPGADAQAFLQDRLAEDVVLEDLVVAEPIRGRTAVAAHLREALVGLPAGARRETDVLTDGDAAAGWAWHLTQGDEDGLRGTTFLEVDPESGKVVYMREGVEPLFKPGGRTAALLKSLAKPDDAWFAARKPVNASVSAEPATCSEAVRYLWLKAQYVESADHALDYFTDDVVYEDFNFEAPFRGQAEVAGFLKEFDIPGLGFVPEKICDGVEGSAFTWRVDIAGVNTDKPIRGVSLYTSDPATINKPGVRAKINYVRDIPEPAVKPPPLLSLAKSVKPGLQTLSPRRRKSAAATSSPPKATTSPAATPVKTSPKAKSAKAAAAEALAKVEDEPSAPPAASLVAVPSQDPLQSLGNLFKSAGGGGTSASKAASPSVAEAPARLGTKRAPAKSPFQSFGDALKSSVPSSSEKSSGAGSKKDAVTTAVTTGTAAATVTGASDAAQSPFEALSDAFKAASGQAPPKGDLKERGDAIFRRIEKSGALERPPLEFYLTEDVLKADDEAA